MTTNITHLVNSTGRQLTMATSVSDVSAVTSGLNTTLYADITESTPDYSYYGEDGDWEPCRYERYQAVFLPPLYIIFFLVGALGNSLVIWVIAFEARLRSMTDVCLLNLAIADLFLVCSLPFQAHQAWDKWVFGDVMCKLVLGIYHIAFYCGIFFISVMSIDRYLAVVLAIYALRARTRSFGLIAAALTWVAGILASFPDLVFVGQQERNGLPFCFLSFPRNDSEIQVWRVFSLFKMNVLGLFVPVLIMGFCYTQIIIRLLSTHSSKRQAIRLVVLVVAVFFFCWIPYNIAAFFKALELLHIYLGCEKSKAIVLALQATEVIAYSHSCLNPILYAFAAQKFRKHLFRLINRMPCGLCQLIKRYLPQDRRGSTYSQTTSLDERSVAL